MTRTTAHRSTLRRLSVALFIIGSIFFFIAPSASAHHFDDHVKERRHIKERALRAVGTPYRYGGSSRSGFDCSGLTRWTFFDHGASLPRTSQEQFDLARRDGVVRVWKRGNLKVGDLVFHKTTSARVGHTGIYIGRGRFISATSGGVAVRSVYDPFYWGPRWVGATRLPATMEFARRGA